MIIDGHVHFWDMARQEDILIVRLRAELQRNYFPKDLWPLGGSGFACLSAASPCR